MKAGSSHFDLDGMGSIIAIPDSRNVPLFLCHVQFNPRTVGDSSGYPDGFVRVPGQLGPGLQLGWKLHVKLQAPPQGSI